MKKQKIETKIVLKRLEETSIKKRDVLLDELNSSEQGILEYEIIAENRKMYGKNVIRNKTKNSFFRKLRLAFINPFSLILILLAMVSFLTDGILAEKKDYTTMSIILIMVFISGVLRFVEEAKSGNAAEKLAAMVETTTCVERSGIKEEIPLDEVVVGDIVHLAAGDIIPADIRILQAKDLFVSQSQLTGESDSVEKTSSILPDKVYQQITDRENLAFMGSYVISGSAKAVVVVVGDETFLGQVALTLVETNEKSSFDKGINSVSWLLIRFMLIMVPIVFFLTGFTKGNWMNAFLFAISIAVGLTPEMLPMIVTSCLAKGAVSLSKKKVIVKNLNSIQNFGAIDLLCTDKTGTLTQDRVVLERHLDVHGNDEIRVLRHAFLNSYYQTGLKNLLDKSIIEETYKRSDSYQELLGLDIQFEKVDEVPFDFNRKRMSVVVANKAGKVQMITKGAVEEIISICSFVEYQGKVLPLTQELILEVLQTVDVLNHQGMRVIAVAQKTNPSPVGTFGVKDEKGMVLIGYLTFLDPPKETTKEAIEGLHRYGIEVKILTGDNANVTRAICEQVGLPNKKVLLGHEVELMTDEDLKREIEEIHIFAKLSPEQKARIIRLFKDNGHVVGYMGDGINDAPALKTADVGISVDTAVDISKEAADIILLEKDLNVLKDGVIEGRKTYANMIKYIKITASSNFGNMFSVLAAAAFLPFLPMLPVHLILLNLIYDLVCIGIPWDNVDDEYIQIPRQWNAKGLGKFMLFTGPVSSIFDWITYLVLYFLICPLAVGGGYHDPLIDQALFIAVFHAGWFIESMWTQTLVIHLIRTAKTPFLHSKSSNVLTILTIIGILFVTILPFTGLGTILDFTALPPLYFLFLFFVVIVYITTMQLVKKIYIKKYHSWL